MNKINFFTFLIVTAFYVYLLVEANTNINCDNTIRLNRTNCYSVQLNASLKCRNLNTDFNITTPCCRFKACSNCYNKYLNQTCSIKMPNGMKCKNSDCSPPSKPLPWWAWFIIGPIIVIVVICAIIAAICKGIFSCVTCGMFNN